MAPWSAPLSLLSNRENFLTDGDKHVNVDLPVLQRSLNVLDVIFVGKGSTILLQTGFDFGPLLFGEEASTTEGEYQLLSRNEMKKP